MDSFPHRITRGTHFRREYASLFFQKLYFTCLDNKKPHPKVALSAGSLRHIHAAPLGLQVLVERIVQDEAVDQAAADVQVRVFPENMKRDILPLRVGQVHVLEGKHVLRATFPVNQVQSVGPSVGDDLKLTLAIGALETEQGPPRGTVLANAGHEDEAFVVLDLSEDLFEDRGAHWRQVVEADEAVSGGVRVLAPELFGP